jgi:hypothetical protein
MLDPANPEAIAAAEAFRDIVFIEERHLYFDQDNRWLPGVTMILEKTGQMDYSFLSPPVRDAALKRGRDVHELTKEYDLGTLDLSTVNPAYRLYLDAYCRFRRDYVFVPDLIEQIVVNRQYHFAGRLDRTGRLRDGTEIILDIKTGEAPEAVPLQLAAYASCLEHPRSRRRRCVELRDTGRYKVLSFETSDYLRDFTDFLAARQLFRRFAKRPQREVGKL